MALAVGLRRAGGSVAGGAALLNREHLLQHREHRQQGALRQSTQALHEPLAIHHAQLIGHDVSLLALKAAGNPEGVGMSACRERSNDEGSHLGVELIR